MFFVAFKCKQKSGKPKTAYVKTSETSVHHSVPRGQTTKHVVLMSHYTPSECEARVQSFDVYRLQGSCLSQERIYEGRTRGLCLRSGIYRPLL